MIRAPDAASDSKRSIRESGSVATSGARCWTLSAEDSIDAFLLTFVPNEAEVSLLRKHGRTILFNYAGTGEHRRDEKTWLRVRESGIDGMLTDYPLDCAQLWQRVRAPADSTKVKP